MSKKRVTGIDAVNLLYKVVSRELNSTTAGKELIMKNAHIEQMLAAVLAKELGLICGYSEHSNDWMHFCTRTPRGLGLCTKHYQAKYFVRIRKE